MDRKVLIYAMVMSGGVLTASLAQVLLRKSAIMRHSSGLKEYLNWRVVTAYLMMMASAVSSLIAYRVIPLSLGAVLDAAGYVYVAVSARFFFGEKIDKNRIAALLFIIGGTGVYVFMGT